MDATDPKNPRETRRWLQAIKARRRRGRGVLTLTPASPPPGQGGERGRGWRRKGPRGLGRPPVEGEARKETAGPRGGG